MVMGETKPPPICDPKKDRHCFDFPEHDVESTFDGVGELVTCTYRYTQLLVPRSTYT